MKEMGHIDRNIHFGGQDHHNDHAPILDSRKTVLVPMVQTMKDYILLHYQRGIAAELCRQIMEGEVATGYDIDDIHWKKFCFH